MALGRYVVVMLAATLLAVTAAMAATAVQPNEADAANTVEVRGCTGTKVVLGIEEKRVLDLHNQARKNKGARALCVHPALQRAAEAHSREMIRRDYHEHDSANGESFSRRLTRYGYRWTAVAENIAYNPAKGLASANRVQSQWMKSSGHRTNILSKRYREVGIGAAYGRFKGDNVTMWTADFGRR